MPTDSPLVSIIIPHQAGVEILLSCLEALERDTSHPHTEIILVDNGSTDGSVEAALERFPKLRVVRLPVNQGYAGGCNRGIELARGSYVLLLNDDAELEPGCLGALVRAAEGDPSLGAAQPKIRSLRERSRFEYSGAAGGLMDVYGYPFSRGRLMGHVEIDRGQYDDPAEVFWASGVCMLIRSSALEEVGALDEAFFAYMEEIDLCWRLQLHAYRVVCVPEAIAYHIGAYSLDRRVLKRMYLNHRNSVIMLVKNYSGRSLPRILPVKLFLELFIMGAALFRNPRRSQAVLMSFAWLLTHVPTLLRLRAPVQRSRKVSDREILARLYQGMAPLWYFVFGVRNASELPDVDLVLHRPSRGAEAKPADETVRPQSRDFLYPYLDQAPAALALERATQCARLARLPFRRPILDAGCGDGTFARILFHGVVVDAGIDANAVELERAREMRCFSEVHAAGAERLPFDAGQFATVLASRSLAGGTDPERVLRELHRVLERGGALYAAVPTARWADFLFVSGCLARLGLRRAADGYAALAARLLDTRSALEPQAWTAMLERVGFSVERCEPYLPRRAIRIQELCLPFAVPAQLARALFGRALLLPRFHRVRARLYRRLLRRACGESGPEGGGVVLVARKR